jgi:hypothetical protein
MSGHLGIRTDEAASSAAEEMDPDPPLFLVSSAAQLAVLAREAVDMYSQACIDAGTVCLRLCLLALLLRANL